jgi:hypothetical protein
MQNLQVYISRVGIVVNRSFIGRNVRSVDRIPTPVTSGIFRLAVICAHSIFNANILKSSCISDDLAIAYTNRMSCIINTKSASELVLK